MAVHSDNFEQIQIANEPDFANLGNSENGAPSTGGLTFAGVCVANPQVRVDYLTAENNSARNRAYKHANVLLTSRGSVEAEVYVRGNGAPEGAFDDPTYKILGQYFSTYEDLLREDTVDDATVSTLDVVDAVESGWTVGKGFYLNLPGRKHFVGFVTSIEDNVSPAADVITFDPPMSTQELSAAQAAIAAGTLVMRGGRTYGLGESYGANLSLSMLGIKRAYATLVQGCRGSTLDARFETGQPGVFACSLTGAHSSQGGLLPTTEVDTWDDPTHCTVTLGGGANLHVGQFGTVTSGGTTYVVQIAEVNGDDIVLEDAGLPAGIIADNPEPSLVALRPGATAEPAGKWLVYLNGKASVDGTALHVRNMMWNINMDPQMPQTPNNLTGAMDIIATAPMITVSVEQSEFNDTALAAFRAGDSVSVLSMLSNGTEGNVVAMYSPAMHYSDVPQAGSADGLITMPLTFTAALYEGDDGDYDYGSTLVDTPLRLFIGW